jgi:predicted nucleic acid-binding protein
MIVVLDASAALEIALNREDSKRFRMILAESDVVIAPNTFPLEITNAIWKYRVFSSVDQDKCEIAINYCLDLVDDYIETKDICREVFSESVNHKHPAYDLFYLILARRNSASILSKDKKMIKIAKEMRIDVIGIKS